MNIVIHRTIDIDGLTLQEFKTLKSGLGLIIERSVMSHETAASLLVKMNGVDE